MAQTLTARAGVNILDRSKPMWRILLAFILPLMASNILQTVGQTCGYIFVGRMLGVNALAGASVVFPVAFFLISFLAGIAAGSTVLIGQAYGAGNMHLVKKIAGTVLGATCATGLFVAVVGSLFSPMILALLRTPPAVLPQADAYAKVIFLAAPILYPYLAYTTFLRGVGDSKTPFYILVVSTGLTLLFIPMLIRGWLNLPAMGMTGAALAGVAGQGIALFALLGWLAFKKHPLKFDAETARDMLVDWKILWSIMKIGVPTAIQIVMTSLAEIAVISFVNRFGASATAAYGAVNLVASYAQFPGITVGVSTSIFCAQAIGARREDLVAAVVRSAVVLNYIIGTILIGLCYLLSWVILGLFIVDVHTLVIAHGLLMITLWSYLLFGHTSVLGGAMRSSGMVFWPTVTGIIAIWAVEVPASYMLMRHFGLNGIWMGYPLAYVAGLFLQFGFYTLFWKGKPHKLLI